MKYLLILCSFVASCHAGMCPTSPTGIEVQPIGQCRNNYPQCPPNSYCFPYREYNKPNYTPVCCPLVPQQQQQQLQQTYQQQPLQQQTYQQQPPQQQTYQQQTYQPQRPMNSAGPIMIPINEQQLLQRSTVDVFQEMLRTYPLLMYSKSTCGYCKRAKQMFSHYYPQYQLYYIDFDIQPGGFQIIDAAQRASRMTTVPQIWLCQQLIGGYDDVQKMHEAGILLPKLRSCFNRYKTI